LCGAQVYFLFRKIPSRGRESFLWRQKTIRDHKRLIWGGTCERRRENICDHKVCATCLSIGRGGAMFSVSENNSN